MFILLPSTHDNISAVNLEQVESFKMLISTVGSKIEWIISFYMASGEHIQIKCDDDEATRINKEVCQYNCKEKFDGKETN